MIESTVERRLVTNFKKAGIELLKFKTPSRRDVPDRICFLDDAVTVLIEVKKPGETLRKKQLLYCKGLVAKGHFVFVIDNTGMVNGLITEVLRLSEKSYRLRLKKTIHWFIYRDGVR